MNAPIPGTVVIYGPHYLREGYGTMARVWAMTLHSAGVKVKVVPVNCNNPAITGGLDDIDSRLLRSLEHTPISPPVTAIFAYVPNHLWPKVPLPEPNLRIMMTTYDSTANAVSPTFRYIYICNQMDQVWLYNQAEEKAWIRGGLDARLVRSFKWPHEWIDNPLLPLAAPKATRGKPFRFLHVSMFIPRRRLDVLIRAFFEEFRTAKEAELYLKMTYPSWHPVPGKPRRDLRGLIDRLRAQTRSQGRLIVDEKLGTRLDMVRLMDSCDVYVSPDTTSTAPVGEAIIRHRPVIITDGWGVDLPPETHVIPNGQERIELDSEMLEYMPNQRGYSFPVLDVGLMRRALRKFFEMPIEENRAIVQASYDYIRERYSPTATAPAAIAAIKEGWENKRRSAIEVRTTTARQEPPAPEPNARKPLNISWCGMQLFYGKIPTANREICLELMRRGHLLSLNPADGPFRIEELELRDSEKYLELARRFYEPFREGTDFNVCSRWHPVFKEQLAAKQIFLNTWWAGSIPVDWVRPISEHVDEVWVPSKFVRDNFLRSGVSESQMRVIPFGFDPAVFRPDAPPVSLKTRRRFKFLFVGEASQRKGIDLLLLAYLKTFTSQDDVCLIVKDMNCEDYSARRAGQELVRQCQANSRCPEIEYLDSMLGETDLPGLYTACDCFIQPFRTSSFGMAVLEAMACGLPVIATNYGGILEFCDHETACLLPAREIRHRSKIVGHWQVDGDQLHAEVKLSDLQERLHDAFQKPSQASVRAKTARERVHSQFTWSRTVDKVLERFESLRQAPARCETIIKQAAPGVKQPVAPTAEARTGGPTVTVFAPFYNRSGYGVAARAMVIGLHTIGTRVRIVPVDNVEPGIDDCDMALLRSLEQTPLTLPLVAIFFHVPSQNWLQVQLPPQSVRIMFTTFDSSAQGNLPPAEWISVCNQMDQVWLMTPKEVTVFAAAGVHESKIKIVCCPSPWVSNPLLPLPQSVPKPPNKPFRFLSIAMFQPRRRWDALIEAYLAEFKDTSNVELCLKVNYPSWHPVPGQPQKDLRQLIESLRARTGSQAQILLDESLDTRLGICRLIDSCEVYVSTDTCSTAPVGEAFARGRITVIPDGHGAALPYCESTFVIPVDPKFTRPISEQELLYQPHHRGRQMPLLHVEDVRRTLRAAFDLPEAQRQQLGHLASLATESSYGLNVLPVMIKAMQACLSEKFGVRSDPTLIQAPGMKPASPSAADEDTSLRLDWEGSFLDFGSLSYVNRELTKALVLQPRIELRRVGSNALTGSAAQCAELQALAQTLKSSPCRETQITVRHAWPPNWTPVNRGALVVIQPWEYGMLPAEWVTQARHVQQFWVPSEHVRQVYVRSGIPKDKVKVVPHGIDPDRFHPGVTPMSLATKKTFKFLFVGGTIHRKGPDVLLDAYLKTFTAQDNVCLVIKDFGGQSVYAGQTFESQIRAAQSQPNAPEILYLNDELPPDSLPGLYTACDCLAHPYRGEGFGLPVLEAMACGLPVIVTAGGAADDFAGDGFAYRIPATKKSIGDSISGMKLAGTGWLLEPDAQALAARMKWIVEHRDDARATGRRASEFARREWTWERAAQIATERLHELQARGETEAKVIGKRSERKTTAIVLPPCALVGHLGQARELLHRKKPRDAWEAALAALQARPFHPEAYLLLAEIAQAAGDSTTARLCAEHARRLAPGWKPARRFFNQRLKGNARLGWLGLPDSVTNRQSPITNRLTACLIARNEEKFIARCLASVRGLADQIVVVDTGSTDRTVEIAKEHGAEVHSFAWCDDFSAGRNAALEHVRGDWVLVLDADEELTAEGREVLLQEMRAGDAMAYRLPIVDVGKEDEGHSYVPRLFRNAPGLFYVGRIHEQVFSSVEVRRTEWGLENKFSKATLLHHGYTEQVSQERDKNARNLRLLELAIEEMPDEPNLLMNYGLELTRAGKLDAALEQYREAFRALEALPEDQVVPELRESLLTQLCTQLMAAKKHAELVQMLDTPLARRGGLTASLHFGLGLAHMELKNFREAAEQFRQCLAKRDQPSLTPMNRDIRKAGPHHCLAVCLMHLREFDAAGEVFQQALAADPQSRRIRFDFAAFLFSRGLPVEALKQLHALVTEKSDELSVWLLGGQIALSQPQFSEFACDWTGEAIKQFPQDRVVALQRAEALLLCGRVAEALPLWRQASASSDAMHRAAQIVCELVAGEPVTAIATSDETVVSREFLKWYRRLLRWGANEVVLKLNENVQALRNTLPTAIAALEAALSEARQPATV